jgi:hypothetical protein
LDKEKVAARKKAKEQKLYQQRYEKKKEDRFTREREELKERAFSFIQRMHKIEEKEFAPHTFPLAAELQALEKPDSFGWIPGTHKRMEHEEITARKVLYYARVLEACERVLWGKVLPETKDAMMELGTIIQRFEDDRAQKAREEEEEKARREAERERERLERLAATERASHSQTEWSRPQSFYYRDEGTIGLQQQRARERDKYPYGND